jgi:hypothetical protein
MAISEPPVGAMVTAVGHDDTDGRRVLPRLTPEDREI